MVSLLMDLITRSASQRKNLRYSLSIIWRLLLVIGIQVHPQIQSAPTKVSQVMR